jgi:hypothetical protein
MIVIASQKWILLKCMLPVESPPLRRCPASPCPCPNPDEWDTHEGRAPQEYMQRYHGHTSGNSSIFAILFLYHITNTTTRQSPTLSPPKSLQNTPTYLPELHRHLIRDRAHPRREDLMIAWYICGTPPGWCSGCTGRLRYGMPRRIGGWVRTSTVISRVIGDEGDRDLGSMGGCDRKRKTKGGGYDWQDG